MRAKLFTTIVIHSIFFGATLTAPAQMSSSIQTISTTGTSNVKCLPEAIRTIVMIQAKGKNIDEALANLKAEQKSALEKLQKIGIEPERVQFKEFDFDQTQETSRRQMEMIINQRTGRPASKTPVAATESVALKCMLFADFDIAGKTPEDILKESYTFKQKITAAEIISKKELTPEEAELEEEMQGMRHSFGNDEQNFDGEPRFVFVAKVSEEECQKAYADAFEQARKRGELLAKAAGVRPGVLLQLSSSVRQKQTANRNPYYSSGQDYYLVQLIGGGQFPFDAGDEDRVEFLATTPDAMEVIFSVQAAFAISAQ